MTFRRTDSCIWGFAFIKLVAEASLEYDLFLGSFDYSHPEHSSFQSSHVESNEMWAWILHSFVQYCLSGN